MGRIEGKGALSKRRAQQRLRGVELLECLGREDRYSGNDQNLCDNFAFTLKACLPEH